MILDSCDLICKITFGFVGRNLGPTLNLNPKISVQNSTSKRGISWIRHLLEDTPGDTEIQVIYLTTDGIGNYQKDGHLEVSRFLKFHVFVFDLR